ncbi:hypothetical protein SAMN04489725_102122 [Alicyclobacillus hesperidum]|uniref:Uncharacterized protein n=1 Tax=Alicyclobacillus hesperidum TaxID=89784 RepID=A0A1H2R145_9BACL|nr:hypothetical protein SAMN04489725_102122 [Alicyclobacillus hesperidum]
MLFLLISTKQGAPLVAHLVLFSSAIYRDISA